MIDKEFAETQSFNALRICITWRCVSLWFGAFSPRKSTNPVSHSCFVLSDRVIHSRFSGLLSNLFPLIWFTVNPSDYPLTKAIAISLCTNIFGRDDPNFAETV